MTIGNQDFAFDSDSFPVDSIARMSPESAIQMQTCQDVQTAAVSTDLPKSNILSYDSNGDMKITREEFIAAHDADNSDEAFNFLKSIQPSVLGKSLPSTESIELGQFFHVNWGWREFAASSGGISLPWRAILENTIGVGGDSAEARVLAFDHSNAIHSTLAKILSDSDRYPTIELMQEHFLRCGALPESQANDLATCSSQTHLANSGGDKYFPVGPGDGGSSTRTNSIFGIPLAYPPVWTPDFYESNYLKVASCIVVNKESTLSEVLESMGCKINIGEAETRVAASAEYEELCTQNKTAAVLAGIFGGLFLITLVFIVRRIFSEPASKENVKATTKENDDLEKVCDTTLHDQTDHSGGSRNNGV